MAAYVNLHAGVGKPLWEITVGEFSVWFKVASHTVSFHRFHRSIGEGRG